MICVFLVVGRFVTQQEIDMNSALWCMHIRLEHQHQRGGEFSLDVKAWLGKC